MAVVRPASPLVFTTERLAPMSLDGFRKLLSRVGPVARHPFPITRICCATPAVTCCKNRTC